MGFNGEEERLKEPVYILEEDYLNGETRDAVHTKLFNIKITADANCLSIENVNAVYRSIFSTIHSALIN